MRNQTNLTHNLYIDSQMAKILTNESIIESINGNGVSLESDTYNNAQYQ